ncbi:MAG: N(2)-acetyl-L-2,4-diaminobutanoate deacetylase DoeB [Gammaproteobacteria bacterium]|nr:N(2)-acetyl-L-2,4-diaminobutanoate deacetylase DoeB [Gammaproteobacteria bacterium]
MKKSPVSTTVDFERTGVQHGFLKLPHSHDRSGWGSLTIPITVAKNGNGPTALFTGANHGDEFEGPVALWDLAHTINADDLFGRVIIIPGMNYPALRAGKRTSPIDGGNMNRVFPGNPEGSITEKIADYFQRTLLPMADFVIDFHSGGNTMEFVPFCCAHVLDNKEQQAQCVAAMRAFNAPNSMMLLEIEADSMYDTAAENMGKVFISTELAGGGTTTAYTVGIAKRGVRNILLHAGIIKGNLEIRNSLSLDMPDGDCFIFSESSGLIEHSVDLGDRVNAGDLVCRVHNIERTGIAPTEYLAKIDGVVAGRHFPGIVGMGDFLSVIAVPM